MREKLSAAGLGLLVAAIVTVSATFAWVTLSRAPEVTGIATTLSANGALEIALSNEGGTQPDEFDIDESVGLKVDLVSSNLQWGNLVNLADDAYGIDNIELRPAQLNISKLLSTPLLGAAYGADGRITEKDTNFAYTKYDKQENKFLVNTTYGVRAISSYTAVKSEGAQAILEQKIKDVDTAMNTVSNTYQEAIDCFPAMGKMISTFAQDKVDKKLGSGSETGSNMGPYLADVLRLYQALYATVEDQKVAYVALANLQLYQWAAENKQNFTPITWEKLYQDRDQYNAADPTQKSKNGTVSLSGLEQFCADAETLKKDMDKLGEYCAGYQAGKAYYWASGGDDNFQIWNMVSRLIDYNGTMYIEINGKKIYVKNLESAAGDLLKANNKTQRVFVDGGVLKRFEEIVIANSGRFGAIKKAKCTVAVKTPIGAITIKGEAYTTASGPSWFESDFAAASKTEVNATVAAAEDTYGMAVDFWLRTNAERTYLTLEGATVTDPATETVLRYDGVNRVWGAAGNALLTRESTTQGGGSCYVYYADTPEDMQRSLALLENLKVAFMDTATGRYMASAILDTEHYWAQNGRITVPLIQDITQPKVTYTRAEEGVDEQGKPATVQREYFALAELVMDDAQRISAIIYLDGTSLSNSEVLAAAKIQGQLNLQFGTSDELQTLGSNELVDDVRTVTAEVSPTTMDFDTAVGDALTASVKLTVKGTAPTTVTAAFVRAINSTQGSRETAMEFTQTPGDASQWTASYQFTAPGTYYLRHVQLDGVDYALSEPVSVEVSGFALKSVSWGKLNNEAKVRTSQGTYTESVRVEFASNDFNKMPDSVQARFVRTDGNTVIIPLTRGTDGVWTGTGTFTTSGVYTWEYLVYTTKDSPNGLYKDLGDSKKTLDLSLGLYAEVRHDMGTLEDHFESGKSYTKKVTVRILDNANNELRELEGAKLYYTSGSIATAIPFELTWNHTAQNYTGEMVFTKAGRYRFSQLLVDGNSITRASESPTYNIVSPDPLRYDEASKTTYHGTDVKNIQFVPLTCDAQIDGIKIINSSSSNTLQAVVYNDEAKQYLTVSPEEVVCDGSEWTVKLPTYTTGEGEQAKQTQDGTWSVAALLLSDCFDENGVYYSKEAPLIWVNDDADAKAYVEHEFAREDGAKPAYTVKDFSLLSTTVSSSVQITAAQKDKGTDGVVKLGGAGTEFMTKFYKNNLGLTVAVTDGRGHPIPAGKVRAMTLHYSYTAPNNAEYGYAVESGANEKSGAMQLTWDAEHSCYTVADKTAWSYVGRYEVKDLTVDFVSGGKTATQTVAAGTNGVPTAYTITTKGPDLSKHVTVKLYKNGKYSRPYGKTVDTVTGTFLQSYDVGTFYAAVGLTAEGQPVQHVSLGDAVSAQLELTYLDGKRAPNGGYTWSGESAYEHIILPMTKQHGSSSYVAGSTPLLSGGYSARVQVTVGGKKLEQSFTADDGSNRVIEVFSKAPDVTMALADGTPTTVTVNADAGTATSTNTFTANNTVVNDGHSAVLFASYRPFTAEENPGVYNEYNQNGMYAEEFAHYEMPELKFTLTDLSTPGVSVEMQVSSSGSVKLENGKETTKGTQIGAIEKGSEGREGYYEYDSIIGGTKTASCTYSYNTEKPQVIGEKEIQEITVTSQGVGYSLKLKTPLTLVQKNVTVPSISFVVDNDKFVTPATKESTDGRSFTYVLPKELVAEAGGNKVTEQVTTVTSETETTGDDPDTQVHDGSHPITKDNMNWGGTGEINRVTSSQKVYTVTNGVVTNKHTVASVFEAEYYKRHITTQLYTINERVQSTSVMISVTGTTTEIKTETTDEMTISLDYWMVNGERCEPGAEVKVSGNSVATPVYKIVQTPVRKLVTTTTVIGETDYSYRAECTAQETADGGAGNEATGTKEFCTHSTRFCKKNKGDKTAAMNDSSVKEPTNPGYTKVSSATAGIVRDVSNSKWERYGDPIVKSGKTTVSKVCYDGNGNVLWSS